MSHCDCWFGLSFLAGGIAGIVLGVLVAGITLTATLTALIVYFPTIRCRKVHYLHEQYSAFIVMR